MSVLSTKSGTNLKKGGVGKQQEFSLVVKPHNISEFSLCNNKKFDGICTTQQSMNDNGKLFTTRTSSESIVNNSRFLTLINGRGTY